MWVVTIESRVLGGVLGRYIQGGVTFKGHSYSASVEYHAAALACAHEITIIGCIS